MTSIRRTLNVVFFSMKCQYEEELVTGLLFFVKTNKQNKNLYQPQTVQEIIDGFPSTI